MTSACECSDDLARFGSHWLHAKKKTHGYRERDEVKRAEFLAQLAEIESSRRVYVDEAGMDQRDDYKYGWNEKGERYKALKSWQSGRTDRVSA
jgi:hypothetical protein